MELKECVQRATLILWDAMGKRKKRGREGAGGKGLVK
jgi:hypothetical protein